MNPLFSTPDQSLHAPDLTQTRLRRRKRSLPVTLLFNITVLVLFVLSTVIPDLLAPYDPNEIGVGKTLTAPSFGFPMGTDEFGRDILSRIIHSARVELLISFASVRLAVLFGVFLGLLAGYRGGLFDAVIMRLQEAILAFPAILFAILVTVALGSSALTIILTVAVIYLPRFARLVRGVVLLAVRSNFLRQNRLASHLTP